MLISLEIKDYALIEKLHAHFQSGLNIITGETGAGKSIVIGAMSLLLGDRASTDIIRKGAKKSIVEGIFSFSKQDKVKAILEKHDLDFDHEIIIRREISLKGSNRCFVNDTPVSLALVKEIGEMLVDLHGQHDHQSLLKPFKHIQMLDEFGDYQDDLISYRKVFKQINNTIKEINSLRSKEAVLREKKELYGFQIKEIDAVSPEIDEDKSISDELRVLENSERLLEKTNLLYEQLYESEESISDRLGSVLNNFNEIKAIDNRFTEQLNDLESANSIINEVSGFLANYKDKIELDPENLETLRERLSAINLLKKKYGPEINNVIDYREKIGNEFRLAENFASEIEKLEIELRQLRVKGGKIASEISAKRKNTGSKLKKEVENSLHYLGITDVVFNISNENFELVNSSSPFLIVNNKKYKADNNGIDYIEFKISTNAGEDPKPLAKIASGGEISRIMLALKTSLAKTDRLPLLIFDEIDTGVSGRIAQKVGAAMKELAGFHQIIAITHLPQIAAQSDVHFSVEKLQDNGRIVSTIKELNDEERIIEVAKLISGENVSDSSISSAKELFGNN